MGAWALAPRAFAWNTWNLIPLLCSLPWLKRRFWEEAEEGNAMRGPIPPLLRF